MVNDMWEKLQLYALPYLSSMSQRARLYGWSLASPRSIIQHERGSLVGHSAKAFEESVAVPCESASQPMAEEPGQLGPTLILTMSAKLVSLDIS